MSHCFLVPYFVFMCCHFLLWLGASKAGSGLGLSGPLRGPAQGHIKLAQEWNYNHKTKDTSTWGLLVRSHKRSE